MCACLKRRAKGNRVGEGESRHPDDDGVVPEPESVAGVRFGRAEKCDEARGWQRVISSKMLGGASQIVSKIRVKCNGN